MSNKELHDRLEELYALRQYTGALVMSRVVLQELIDLLKERKVTDEVVTQVNDVMDEYLRKEKPQ